MADSFANSLRMATMVTVAAKVLEIDHTDFIEIV